MIIKPIKAKTKPPVLSWLMLTSSNFFNIFLIFDGNIAYRIPSINKKRPSAMISSFINIYCDLGFIFPKNLKNSLSGERINDVSPPIKAFS